ncbi:MAG: DUF1828 domain-containing protein [Nitrospiria bacterium]
MLEQLEKHLCERLCAEVRLHRRNGLTMLETPFTFPDGDHYPIYLSETRTGGLRISDGGHTLMHLSYENEVDKFFEGTRGLLLEQIKGEYALNYEAGQFFMESSVDETAETIFKFGQALTRIYDLTFLNRSRVASTFYDDLQEQLHRIVGEDKIQKEYLVPGLDNAGNYLVDFFIKGKHDMPLFLYGVPNRDKARLTTIFLQYFINQGIEFDSFLVFENQQEMPRADLARLSNVGGEMIASLNAEDDFKRKLLKKAA